MLFFQGLLGEGVLCVLMHFEPFQAENQEIAIFSAGCIAIRVVKFFWW